MMIARRVLPLASAVLLGSSLLAEDVEEAKFTSEGRARKYAVYAPPASGPRPLVIVLHGSGGTGRSMVDLWKDLARRKGFVVAGLDASNRQAWGPPKDTPAVLRDLVDALDDRQVDGRRVYLFGHSAGGIFTLYMAPLECQYFAAAAVHAAAFGGEADPGYLAQTERKIPIIVIAGSDDRLFPLVKVRKTVALLQRHGLPTTLSLIPGGTHAYTQSADVNLRAWTFLKEHSLDSDPVYVPVEFGSKR